MPPPLSVAGPPAEDPSAEVPAALSLLPVVPHLPAGRVPGHGDAAEHLPGPQPERVGDFAAHDLGGRYIGGASLTVLRTISPLETLFLNDQPGPGHFSHSRAALGWGSPFLSQGRHLSADPGGNSPGSIDAEMLSASYPTGHRAEQCSHHMDMTIQFIGCVVTGPLV